MSEPSAPLQFDKAELDAPGPAVCAVCGKPLVGSYFTVNGQVTCGACEQLVRGHFSGAGGSGAVRFLKAAALGLAGGLVGTVVWYVVEHAFSLQIGLISILVGYLAGTGVAKGSGGVGGVAYQVLAAGLAYICICFAWAPDIAESLGKPRPTAAEKTAQAPPPVVGDAPSGDAAALDAAPLDEAAPAEARAEQRPLPAVVLWPLALVVSLAVPFMGEISVLGLLIAAFGIWEAWRRNRRPPLNIAGPFALGAAAPASAGSGPGAGG